MWEVNFADLEFGNGDIYSPRGRECVLRSFIIAQGRGGLRKKAAVSGRGGKSKRVVDWGGNSISRICGFGNGRFYIPNGGHIRDVGYLSFLALSKRERARKKIKAGEGGEKIIYTEA